MSADMNKSGAFTLKKGEIAALEGEKTTSLKLLLQGKLEFYITPSNVNFPVNYKEIEQKCYKLFDINQSLFTGANDVLISGRNSLSAVAAAECSLFYYGIDNLNSIRTVISNQKDYGSYIVNSICNLINCSYQALQKISSDAFKIVNILDNLSVFYMALTGEFDLKPFRGKFAERGSERLKCFRENNILIPLHFSRQFAEASILTPNEIISPNPEATESIRYFTHLYNLSSDIKKAFFGADQLITESNVKAASKCLEQLLMKLKETLGCLENAMYLLYSENEDCAYKAFFKAAGEISRKGLDLSPALNASEYIYCKLNDLISYMEFEYKHKNVLDMEYFKHLHSSSIAAASATPSGNMTGTISSNDNPVTCQSLPEELNNSAARILEYSEISEETKTGFLMNLTTFRNLRDRLSTDESAKAIRKAVTDDYFKIFKAVFIKSHKSKDTPRLIRMFLSFGFMDERLLDMDQVMAIYKLAGNEISNGFSNIFSMEEWLTKIIELEKEPSVNQFGQDYNDIFRELKKRGQADDKDRAAYDNNSEAKLEFEVDNMFLTNHKLCQGQISSYFPILHKDMAPANPARSLLTPAIVMEKLNKILEIDFSAFHREIYYMDNSKNIEKELVMMQVMPDIILLPVYGSRAIMWQEITGRARNTPGRFLLPAFTDENIDDMLIRLVGNFRWELCRTMMGAAWNDVTQSSLTSEYTDYIQFYRKNRELSDEAKEKIKTQCVKYHNKMRDIFTSDYELWINNESKGNPRLNKVARSILFRYCPFSRNIRDQLEKQPMYVDMASQLKIQRIKQIRELENHYKLYCKNNSLLDTVLEENLKFYRN